MLQLNSGLLATADAGQTWRHVPLPPGQSFGLGAHLLSPSEGWYHDLAAYPNQSAQPSSMWWTADAGGSWKLLWQVNADHPAAGSIPLDGIKFVLGFDGVAGWLALRDGPSERLLQTVDGGTNWTQARLPVAEPVVLDALQLLGDGGAVLIAQAGTRWWAIRSSDGGRTWKDRRTLPMATPLERGGYDRPAFVDSAHWLVAGGSVVHTTTDGGQTWRDKHAHLPGGIVALHDLWLFADGKGWATGTDIGGGVHVLRTNDGGNSWSLSPVPQL
jgi:photosystem II stability/assembly factor-like uncharacterized protein